MNKIGLHVSITFSKRFKQPPRNSLYRLCLSVVFPFILSRPCWDLMRPCRSKHLVVSGDFEDSGLGDCASPGFIWGGFDNGEVWHLELKSVSVGIVEYSPWNCGVPEL